MSSLLTNSLMNTQEQSATLQKQILSLYHFVYRSSFSFVLAKPDFPIGREVTQQHGKQSVLND